jgi:hypothetical protein
MPDCRIKMGTALQLSDDINLVSRRFETPQRDRPMTVGKFLNTKGQRTRLEFNPPKLRISVKKYG